jgi:VIT1/CCC1 family predicted Fe2+/Mn2+ transporter
MSEEIRLPHEFDHTHADVSGGWLRAATFGAMDGLVSNTALIAGVGASASSGAVVLAGVSGLLSGAFSMALGEFTSVTTANEQIDSEVKVEKRAFRANPRAEKAELVQTLMQMGLSEPTATQATEELHRDEKRAVRFHLVQELGVDPTSKPSPWVAGGSSFAMFAVGAIIPLLPFLLGFESLWAGLACGGAGLLVVGAVAAKFTKKLWWAAGLRQLFFGGVAIAATYLVGHLIGSVV